MGVFKKSWRKIINYFLNGYNAVCRTTPALNRKYVITYEYWKQKICDNILMLNNLFLKLFDSRYWKYFEHWLYAYDFTKLEVGWWISTEGPCTPQAFFHLGKLIKSGRVFWLDFKFQRTLKTSKNCLQIPSNTTQNKIFIAHQIS